MTLLIQRTEHRDPGARLDELLHAHSQANNALTKIDDEEPEDIVGHRTQARVAD
jgi:low affinity Fe/Cu permease